jgi:hypothetical protein
MKRQGCSVPRTTDSIYITGTELFVDGGFAQGGVDSHRAVPSGLTLASDSLSSFISQLTVGWYDESTLVHHDCESSSSLADLVSDSRCEF